MRIILDTNVLIAAFATRGLCQAVFAVTAVTGRRPLGEVGG